MPKLKNFVHLHPIFANFCNFGISGNFVVIVISEDFFYWTLTDLA